jgi:hypothetical protein
MKLKTLLIAALACVSIGSGIAQGYGQGNRQDDYRYNNQRNNQRYSQQNWRRDMRRMIDRTERESNSFRQYFEDHFRANGHERRYGGETGHAEHQGRNGQMSLKDAIQNLDEDMERLRHEVDRNRDMRYARALTDEIRDHAADVDARMPRVAEWYSFGGDRRWRWDSSELSQRWSRLRGDIAGITGYWGRR